jgi:AcrR family transcriptional regulator
MPARRALRSNQLSRDAIVDAALRLTRRVGVEQLTMRSLAEELGVSPMATYYYVENRDALLCLVADAVIASVLPPRPESAPWDDRLWQYMKTMGAAMAQYPGLSDFLVQHDSTREARRYMERCVDILADGGFEPEAARDAFNAIYAYMWGRSTFRAVQTRRRAEGHRSRRHAGHRLPTIDELASEEHEERGYRALVIGLAQTVHSRILRNEVVNR